MNRFTIAVAWSALMFCGAASAADLPSSLQHTWKITRADGSTFSVSFHADGTYTTDTTIHGTWKIDGQSLCVTRSTGESNCNEGNLDRKPGDSWKSEDAAGNPITVTLE